MFEINYGYDQMAIDNHLCEQLSIYFHYHADATFEYFSHLQRMVCIRIAYVTNSNKKFR